MARKRKHRRASMRAAERLRDSGPDPSGNYGVNPYAARGHVVEMAPKDIGTELPKNSQFPKRIVTQRVVDRYRARGHITDAEHKAAVVLWELWVSAGNEARVTSGYEPVIMSSAANMDARIAKRIDSATAFLELMKLVPYRSQGVVRAVVVEDWSASDWAKLRGLGRSDSERHGIERLRSGLQALARFLGT